MIAYTYWAYTDTNLSVLSEHRMTVCSPHLSYHSDAHFQHEVACHLTSRSHCFRGRYHCNPDGIPVAEREEFGVQTVSVFSYIDCNLN